MASHNHHWLRKWLRFEPHFTIYQEGQPYLHRWFVLPRNPIFNIYLHKFVKSDFDEALHDHPWWFVSWILKGEYFEHTPGWQQDTHRRLRRRWSIAYRPAEAAHRVELLRGPAIARERTRVRPVGEELPVWMLFVTGRKVREWGFHCPKGWLHWSKFTSGDHGETRVGCGEYA